MIVAKLEDAGHEVRLVTGWIIQQPARCAILGEAEHAEPGLVQDILVSTLEQGGRELGRHFRWPSGTEAERVALSGS